MTHKQIATLVKEDRQIQTIHNIVPWSFSKDPGHLKRRQQQRGISEEMIKIALVYGVKNYRHGAALYTLTDRTLEKSPYAKYTQELRGLTVVCKVKSILDVATAYWNRKIIRHTKKK